ncbi:putative lipoprotein [Leptospira santarosai str. 200403458]|nr:putative lipoprotein [Leptospira santarosai str. 200403458]
MKRFISLFLILTFVSCSSYQSKVEKNKVDLDRVEQIVLESNDIPKGDKDFITKTLKETKETFGTREFPSRVLRTDGGAGSLTSGCLSVCSFWELWV